MLKLIIIGYLGVGIVWAIYMAAITKGKDSKSIAANVLFWPAIMYKCYKK